MGVRDGVMMSRAVVVVSYGKDFHGVFVVDGVFLLAFV